MKLEVYFLTLSYIICVCSFLYLLFILIYMIKYENSKEEALDIAVKRTVNFRNLIIKLVIIFIGSLLFILSY